MRWRKGVTQATPDRPQVPPARQGWRLNHFIRGGHATPTGGYEGGAVPFSLMRPDEDKAGRTGLDGASSTREVAQTRGKCVPRR